MVLLRIYREIESLGLICPFTGKEILRSIPGTKEVILLLLLTSSEIDDLFAKKAEIKNIEKKKVEEEAQKVGVVLYSIVRDPFYGVDESGKKKA